MIITSIERQKKDENRFSVFIDGEFKFGMTEIDVLYFKLKEGDNISLQQYEYILDNLILTKAKDSAFRYLGFKPRTYREVYEKLLDKEYSVDVTEKVMAMLTSYGYVDDHDYVKRYIKERGSSKREGIKKIKYDLLKRGIAEDTINEFLDEITEDSQLEDAIAHLEKKKKCPLDFKEKQRLYNYLLRRGFSYDIIGQAFDRI